MPPRQAHVALHLHDLADRFVLGGAQLVAVDSAGLEVSARTQQLGRPQQAPDVIGAERR